MQMSAYLFTVDNGLFAYVNNILENLQFFVIY